MKLIIIGATMDIKGGRVIGLMVNKTNFISGKLIFTINRNSLIICIIKN